MDTQIDHEIVTLLSVMAVHSIAVPLSPAFTVHELQYIIGHSQASMLLTSEKFEEKALAVLQQEPNDCKVVRVVKKAGGAKHIVAKFDERSDGSYGPGGMMLYTSGTTNRPVSNRIFHGCKSELEDRKGFCYPSRP